MTGRELVLRTLRQEEVERLPRQLWTVPYIQMFRGDELSHYYKMYPSDFTGAPGIKYGKSPYVKGEPHRIGQWVDDFGSRWTALEDGIAGEVKDPPIRTEDDLDRYRLPVEMLDDIDCSGQAQAYKETDDFVLAGSQVRPFERMQFLRGTEQLYMDIATEDPIFLRLLEMLHEYNVRELKILAAQAADGVTFMDDWGTQRSLLISPVVWRKYFKPMYKEYCKIIHAGGKYAFFHTDGNTESIFGDLIEIGVDALNSQLFCMDMERLGKQYAGKVTFWGELDRQHILPFGTEEEVRESVRRFGRALLTQGKRTGVIAELSWETATPLSNVLAAYDELAKL